VTAGANFVPLMMELQKCRPCFVVMGTRILASCVISETMYSSISAIGDFVPWRALTVFCFSHCLMLPALIVILSPKPYLSLVLEIISVNAPLLNLSFVIFDFACASLNSFTASSIAKLTLLFKSSELAIIEPFGQPPTKFRR
jgi:hypothetical protein